MSSIWFVTGTSVGLGRAVVEAVLAAGHTVVATARKTHTLDDLAARYPDRLLALPLDVTDPAAWKDAVATTVQRFGRIDVLVNNAGFSGMGSVEDIPVDLVRAQFETNFMGTLHACQAVVPVMRAQGRGRILLVSSIGARIAVPGAGAYFASKAAVSSLAETLAQEVAPFGITVTAVEPGGMRTRFAEKDSLQVSAYDPAYEPSVGATLSMMRSPEYKSALHDPMGHAAMILALASLDHAPVRLLAGADAYDYGIAAGSQHAAADQLWGSFSRAATRFETRLAG